MKPIIFNKEQVEYLEECLNYVLNEIPVNKKESYLIRGMLSKLKNSKKPPIKVSSRKAKGRDFQYWVCNKIASVFGIEFNQKDDNCLIHSREMGQSGLDIVLRGDIKKNFPFSIECKNQENLSIKDWIRQAKNNEQANTSWMLIFKNKEFKEPIVCLEFETFLKHFKK